MKHLLIFLSLIFLSSHAFTQNNQITSFSKSKKLLLKLYKDNPVTLYCGCSFKGFLTFEGTTTVECDRIILIQLQE